jgi:hypothetical protein
VEAVVPAPERILATGAAGTILFCDTSGLHRGGYATLSPRVLAQWAFVTPASVLPRRFQVDWNAAHGSLSAAARFALS